MDDDIFLNDGNVQRRQWMAMVMLMDKQMAMDDGGDGC